MENESVLYYDGVSARPSPARVLIFHDQVHLYSLTGSSFHEAFPSSEISINHVGDTIYLYLDKTGLKYLQYNKDHTLAPVLAAEAEKNKRNWAQRLVKQPILVLLSLVLALAIGLYLFIFSAIPSIGMRFINVEQEIKLGNQLKDVMLRQESSFGNSVNMEGSQLLQQFTDKIKFSTQYPIRVTVVNSNAVNAYALPGGNVVVYAGILRKIKNPEELAALLAHESTHVNERHSLRSLLRSAANGIIFSVVLGDVSGISGAVLSNAETLNGLRYSRSLEAEADQKGMELMVANKINVNGMQQLMQILQKEENLPEGLSFLSDHPLTKQRIEAAKQFAREHRQVITEREDLAIIFERLKKKIN